MPEAVNLAAEFEAPPATVTSNESVDLMAEFDAPPRQEQHAIINDAAAKANQWKRATPAERFGFLMDNFGEHFGETTKKQLASDWERINTPLAELPTIPEGAAVPMPGGGTTNLPILTGAYNGIAPVLSSLTTPLNLGTLGAFGALTKAAQGYGPAAKAAQSALTLVKAAFGMEMAKGAGEAAGRASVPAGKSTQEQTADVVGAAAQAALAAVVGASATTIEPSVRGRPVNPEAVNEAIGKATDAKITQANEVMAKPAATPMPVPTPNVEFVGVQEGVGNVPSFRLYNLKEDIPGHPKGSTVSEKTLVEAGFDAAKLPTERPKANKSPELMTPAEWVEAGNKKGTQWGMLHAAIKEGKPVNAALFDEVVGGLPNENVQGAPEYVRDGDIYRPMNLGLDPAKMTEKEAARKATSEIKINREDEIERTIESAAHSHIGMLFDPKGGGIEKVFADPKYRDAINKIMASPREVLRKKYGDNIKLYRAESTGAEPRNIFSYALDRKTAEQYAGYGDDVAAGRVRPISEVTVPVDKILWIDDSIVGEGSGRGSAMEVLLDKRDIPTSLASEFTPPAAGTPEAVKLEAELAKPKLAAEVSTPSPTAVMNAVVDAERVKRGLPPAMETEARSDTASWDAALKKLDENPEASAVLVDDLIKEPRAINDVETALIRHRQISLQNQFDRVADGIIKAAESKDTTKLAELTAERDRLSDDLVDVYDAGKLAGTETGRGLRARRVMQNEDYSLARMVTTRRAVNDGRPLSEAQMAEVQELHAKIAETQKKFDEYVAKAEERMAKLEKPRAGTTNTDRNIVNRYISEKAASARERIKARYAEGRVQSGLDPADIADHAIVGAEYIAKGVEKFGEWSTEMVKEFGERIKPHLQAIFDKSKEFQTVAAAQRAEEIRLKTFKTRAGNKVEELTERMELGDFTPPAKRPPLELDAEGRALQARLDVVKEDYANALERDRIKNLTAFEHLKETVMHSYDMARLLMTTGEFSFILRQGKVGALSHPILTAKALPNAFRALVANPEAAHALNLEIVNHPDIAAARAAKLFLIEKGHSLSKSEEFIMAKWADRVPIVGKFNQAAEVFLNKLRFDMWRAMRGTGGLTLAQDRQLAMFVNEATGRGGLGKLEAAAVPLGRLMFSPRFFASRLQLLTGHSMWGGDARTRRIIGTEYARALVGLAAYYSLLRIGLHDDKKGTEIVTDPRSSDFGKIRIGETRLDPLAGLAQTIVFGARTATGEKTTLKGKVQDIRGPKVPYGGAKWSDVATSFARSKLHPVPGAIVNLFDGTDLAGQKAELSNQALNLAAPITYADIYQALEEQDLPEGVALGLLAMLGEGLQTYNKRGKAAPIPDAPAFKEVSLPSGKKVNVRSKK